MATKISDMTAGAVADMDKDQTGFESSINLSTVPLTRRLTAGTIAQWLRQIGFGIAVAAVSPAAVTLGFNSGSGVDNAAGNVTFVAPLSTGAATPATMGFQIGLAIASGAGLQTAHTSALYTPNGILFGVDQAAASARTALENQGPNKVISYGDSVTGRARFTQVTIGNANIFDFYQAGGTVAAPAAPGISTAIGGFQAGGYDGATWQQGAARVNMLTTEAWGVGANGTQIGFFTTQTGTAVANQVATLDNDGQFALTGRTVTTSRPIITATQTWNAGGVTFTGIKLNVTNTASAAASLLLDLQVGAASQFSVNESGAVVAASTITTGSNFVSPDVSGYVWTSRSRILSPADGQINLVNHAIGSGFGFDVTTDGVAKFRNRAQNADAAITAAAGTFSNTLTVTQATANASALTSTGYSLTAANAQNMVALAGTWNTSGVPTAFNLAITNTAVGAGALLMNLLAGAGGVTSMFSVDPTGIVTAASTVNAGGDFTLPNGNKIQWGTRTRLQANAASQLNIVNNTNTAGVGFDVTTDGTLQVRVRAQNAFGFVQGKIQTDTARAAGVLVQGGSVTMYDSTGTAITVLTT